MLFQKLTDLVALMVFALHGAMALPHPSTPGESIADNLEENGGKTAGVVIGKVIVPGKLKDAGVKAAGGTVHQPSTPDGSLADNLEENVGKAGGSVFGNLVLPGKAKDAAIKGAGGSIPDHKD